MFSIEKMKEKHVKFERNKAYKSYYAYKSMKEIEERIKVHPYRNFTFIGEGGYSTVW